MFPGKKIAVATTLLLLLAPGRAAFAADDKERVLRQLDASAAKFRNTSADFQFHAIQTDPVFDEEVQEGAIYYERAGGNFQMAGHIAKVNGKAVPKVYTFSHGVFRLYEKLINQITVFKAGDKAEGYVILGFGASGKDLEEKWEIKYLGPESLADGKTMVKTEKLELVAKDPAVRKNIRKVTVWMDTERGVSLKQLFDQGATTYRVSVYFDIKTNQPLPADAFTFKTTSHTHNVVQ